MAGYARTSSPLISSIVLPTDARNFPSIEVTGNGWVKSQNGHTYGRGREGIANANKIMNRSLKAWWEAHYWAKPTKIEQWAGDKYLTLSYGRNDAFGFQHDDPIFGTMALKGSLQIPSRWDKNGKTTIHLTATVPHIYLFWATRGAYELNMYDSHKWLRETGVSSLVDFSDPIKALEELVASLNNATVNNAIAYDYFKEIGFVEVLENIHDYLPNKPDAKTPKFAGFYLAEGLVIAFAKDEDKNFLGGKYYQTLAEMKETFSYIGVEMDVLGNYNYEIGDYEVTGVRFVAKDPKQQHPHTLTMSFTNGVTIDCGYVDDEDAWLHHEKRKIAEDLAAFNDL